MTTVRCLRHVCVRVRRPRGERGSFAFAVMFWALITMMLAGFIVDGGLAITERQRAGDVAEQAARAGAEKLNLADLRQDKFSIDHVAATTAVQDVGVASGLAATAVTVSQWGTTTLPNGRVVPSITVQVTISYSPVLIGMFYSGNFTAIASATAYPQPGT